MGETTVFLRRQRHLKTTIAGFLFPIALAMKKIPSLMPYADFCEALAGFLVASFAADATRKVESIDAHEIASAIAKAGEKILPK